VLYPPALVQDVLRPASVYGKWAPRPCVGGVLTFSGGSHDAEVERTVPRSCRSALERRRVASLADASPQNLTTAVDPADSVAHCRSFYRFHIPPCCRRRAGSCLLPAGTATRKGIMAVGQWHRSKPVAVVLLLAACILCAATRVSSHSALIDPLNRDWDESCRIGGRPPFWKNCHGPCSRQPLRHYYHVKEFRRSQNIPVVYYKNNHKGTFPFSPCVFILPVGPSEEPRLHAAPVVLAKVIRSHVSFSLGPRVTPVDHPCPPRLPWPARRWLLEVDACAS